MTTRCKMTCQTVSTSGGGENQTHEAIFMPVTGGCKENEDFYKWTPGGELKLSVLKNQNFESGKDYYIDISLAE